MATFVLVHGTWHGGWCWRKVTPLLVERGHTVYAPTLTGMGERAHLLSEAVGLDMHIRDILQVLFFEDLRDMILVGHSYAGSILSAVAETVADRIARLVYLDAFIPRDGDSLFSMLGARSEAYYRNRADEEGRGWLIPPLSPKDFGVTDPADIAWMQTRLVAVPVSTFADPVRLPGNAAAQLPRSYIFCKGFGFSMQAAQAKAEGWDYHELATGHDAMITKPRELTEILVEPAVCASSR